MRKGGGMKTIDDVTLGKTLVEKHYLSQKELGEAIAYSKKNARPLADYFFANKILSKDLLGQAIAEWYGVAYADLNSNPPSQEDALKIPYDIATRFRVVYFSKSEGTVICATDDPTQDLLRPSLTAVFPDTVISLAYSIPEDIDAILLYYRKPLATRFSQIISEKKRIAPEFVEEIFRDALAYRASDIHFEPFATDVLVRFRIDGVMQEAGRFEREYYENILNRIKIRSNLRIDEHYATQDGALRYSVDGGTIDMRCSIAPTAEGEKIVLRILAAYISGFSLADLGLTAAYDDMLQAAIRRPFGMIIVTGPTGSGKTTTLYAILKILNRSDVNITTIEDPIEFKMRGVNQIQVNPRTQLTFEKGLRSIIRQDPDIILVGEIRDEETAEIAVNAALTGHLLLTTFHANDAASAIPRLFDMGIEPFLIASTLEIIVAQRLVRKICEHCRSSADAALLRDAAILSILKKFYKKKKIQLYRGKGCDQCGQSGYRGRTALFQIIRMTPALRELVIKKPSSQQIWELAAREGAHTLFEDGLGKVEFGITTIDEVLRVAEPPER